MTTEDRNEKIRPLELYRQPAYAAVYRVIRECPPRSSDDYGKAAENARVWRAVDAALDAMGVATGSPYTGLEHPHDPAYLSRPSWWRRLLNWMRGAA